MEEGVSLRCGWDRRQGEPGELPVEPKLGEEELVWSEFSLKCESQYDQANAMQFNGGRRVQRWGDEGSRTLIELSSCRSIRILYKSAR